MKCSILVADILTGSVLELDILEQNNFLIRKKILRIANDKLDAITHK